MDPLLSLCAVQELNLQGAEAPSGFESDALAVPPTARSWLLSRLFYHAVGESRTPTVFPPRGPEPRAPAIPPRPLTMPGEGVAPSRCFHHTVLSRARLLVPPSGLGFSGFTYPRMRQRSLSVDGAGTPRGGVEACAGISPHPLKASGSPPRTLHVLVAGVQRNKRRLL